MYNVLGAKQIPTRGKCGASSWRRNSASAGW